MRGGLKGNRRACGGECTESSGDSHAKRCARTCDIGLPLGVRRVVAGEHGGGDEPDGRGRLLRPREPPKVFIPLAFSGASATRQRGRSKCTCLLLSALHRTARIEDLTRIRIVGPGQTPSPCPIVRKSASPVASLFPACAAACCLPTAIPPALPHSLPPASAVVSWSLFPNAKAAEAGSREKGRRSAVASER